MSASDCLSSKTHCRSSLRRQQKEWKKVAARVKDHKVIKEESGASGGSGKSLILSDGERRSSCLTSKPPSLSSLSATLLFREISQVWQVRWTLRPTAPTPTSSLRSSAQASARPSARTSRGWVHTLTDEQSTSPECVSDLGRRFPPGGGTNKAKILDFWLFSSTSLFFMCLCHVCFWGTR